MTGMMKWVFLGPPLLLYFLLGAFGLPWFIRAPVLVVLSGVWIAGVAFFAFSQ